MNSEIKTLIDRLLALEPGGWTHLRGTAVRRMGANEYEIGCVLGRTFKLAAVIDWLEKHTRPGEGQT